MNELHVHRVDGRENICSSLYHTFPGLRHGDGCACGEEDGLVAAAEWKVGEIMALYENDFLIAEAHLPSRVSAKSKKKHEISTFERLRRLSISSPANIHPTQEHSLLTVHGDTAVMVKTVQ